MTADAEPRGCRRRRRGGKRRKGAVNALAECAADGSEVDARHVTSDETDFQLALHEANHRMANTLAILAASLQLSLRAIEDDRAKVILRDHVTRIASFGNLHRHFVTGPDEGPVEVAGYIRSLCEHLIAAILAPAGIKCDAVVGEGAIDAQTCETLGRIVSELVTNAAKHAFPGGTGGRVRVEVFESLNVWHCVVSDDGAGLGRAAGGAGSLILDTLVRTLRGRIERRSGPRGTTVMVSFLGRPLEIRPPAKL
ncbi:MAG TPA: sensor histidine kinase [Rhizomicrobium sp.]